MADLKVVLDNMIDSEAREYYPSMIWDELSSEDERQIAEYTYDPDLTFKQWMDDFIKIICNEVNNTLETLETKVRVTENDVIKALEWLFDIVGERWDDMAEEGV